MRAFVAIALEAAARREIAAAEQAVRAGGGAAGWVREENLHLTVAFLGNIDEALVPTVDRRLAPLARSMPQQQLALAGGGGLARRPPEARPPAGPRTSLRRPCHRVAGRPTDPLFERDRPRWPDLCRRAGVAPQELRPRDRLSQAQAPAAVGV